MSSDFKEFIIIKEGFIRSILADAFTYGGLVALLFINYQYLGNSTLVKVFIITSLLLFLLGRNEKNIKRFGSVEEAIKHLRGNTEEGDNA